MRFHAFTGIDPEQKVESTDAKQENGDRDRYGVDGCVYKHNIECCATLGSRSMLFSRVNVSENNLKHTFLFTQIRVPFGLIKKRFETFNVRCDEFNAIWFSVDNKWNCFDFFTFASGDFDVEKYSIFFDFIFIAVKVSRIICDNLNVSRH